MKLSILSQINTVNTPTNYKKTNRVYKYSNNTTNNNITFQGSPIAELVGRSSVAKNLIPDDTFFIRMNFYGRDGAWATKMSELVKSTSEIMANNSSFSDILEQVISKLKVINSQVAGFGIKKKILKGFHCLSNDGRGMEYYPKCFRLCKKNNNLFICKSNNEYKDAATCTLTKMDKSNAIIIRYGFNKGINLTLANNAYKKLKTMKNPTKKDIVDTAATIQWLIAQETPFIHGSDSIATILSRSLMHSYGCKLSPLKSGVSCDFEAFCTNLDDYIKYYPNFFEINPITGNHFQQQLLSY